MNYFGDIRFATCHPDRKYYSKGLCSKCYGALMRERHKKKYKDLKQTAKMPSSEYIYSKHPIVDIPDMIKNDYFINQTYAMPKLITI